MLPVPPLRYRRPPADVSRSRHSVPVLARVLGMAWRIASIATAVTVVGTLFSTQQPDEDAIATLLELNGKGLSDHCNIHHPARTLFGDVEIPDARQFVFDRLIYGHFIGQTTFETATHTG